jgi:hypothetical protein
MPSGARDEKPTTDNRSASQKVLTPAAQRALAEAQARRAARDAEAAKSPKEKESGGRGGLDPVRYGDWEKDGGASDF